METKEQKIERLNKIIQRNQLIMGHLMAFGTDKQIDKCWKEIEQAEQELKELEEERDKIFKRYTENKGEYLNGKR